MTRRLATGGSHRPIAAASVHLRRRPLRGLRGRHARVGAARQRRRGRRRAASTGRPRGIFGRRARRSPNALVRSSAAGGPSRCCARPTVELVDGLAASRVAGRRGPRSSRRSATAPRSTTATRALRRAGGRRRAGRAGRGAAAARTGARVILVDDGPSSAARCSSTDGRVGLRGRSRACDATWRAPTARRDLRPRLRRARSSATTTWPPTRRTRRGSGCGTSARAASCSRPARIERPLVFAGNDRPGIMLAARRARPTSTATACCAGPARRGVHQRTTRPTRRRDACRGRGRGRGDRRRAPTAGSAGRVGDRAGRPASTSTEPTRSGAGDGDGADRLRPARASPAAGTRRPPARQASGRLRWDAARLLRPGRRPADALAGACAALRLAGSGQGPIAGVPRRVGCRRDGRAVGPAAGDVARAPAPLVARARRRRRRADDALRRPRSAT